MRTETERDEKLRRLIQAGLFAAFTFVATSAFRIPTPGGGYVHIGDSFVLLSGLLLHPFYGAISAGIGSALADLFAGYGIYVPGTFAIKALGALGVWWMYRWLPLARKERHWEKGILMASLVLGEVIIQMGYLLYDTLVISFMDGVISAREVHEAMLLVVAGLPEELFQAVAGIVLAFILYPILKRIEAKYR